MAKKVLVIVESPAKARTIGPYLGRDYEVAASVGHVRDLPAKGLGVDVDAGFEPEYETIPGKAKVLRKLKRKARGADEVILATDPDREGEAIAYHVAEQLGYPGAGGGRRFRRVQFHEITRSAVRAALEREGDLDMRKVEAQQARRILDRLVGYRVSPFLWGPIRRGLSAGRVQTVALRLICEREEAIRAFEPDEYWSITAHLQHETEAFDAKLHQIDGEAVRLADEGEASATVEDLDGVPFRATAVKRRERRKNPFPPFTTSTLQQQAAHRLRFPARKTMRVAQRLYEGIAVGSREATGLITYMRTDSTRVAAEAADAARRWVKAEMGANYLPRRRRLWGGKQQKGAQEAHEAIRPTSVALHPSEVARHLRRDEAALYELIWVRFVASQMAPAVYDSTTVDFDLEGRNSGRGHRFRAKGSVVKFPGFTRLEREASERVRRRPRNDLKPLPDLKKGDVAELDALEPGQHFTKPPPRFSEASLVKELEAQGIGRPSTYAQTIATLLDREYVELVKRRFSPTDLGEVVANLLVRVFPDIFDVEFTSRMESQLDRVEEGGLEWRALLESFYPRLEERLEAGRKISGEIVKEALEASDQSCPKCGEPMLVRWNKHGRFLGCSAYPKCKETRSLDGSGAGGQRLGTAEDSGREILLKKGPYGPYLEMAAEDGGGEPRRVSVPKGREPADVDLAYARKLLSLPRALGTDPESGEEVVAGLGRYGPYVRRGKTFGNLKGEDELFGVDLAQALEIIRQREELGGRMLADLGEHPYSGGHMRIMDGKYSPYVTDGTLKASLPKGVKPGDVTPEQGMELLARKARKKSRKGRKRGKRRKGRGRR